MKCLHFWKRNENPFHSFELAVLVVVSADGKQIAVLAMAPAAEETIPWSQQPLVVSLVKESRTQVNEHLVSGSLLVGTKDDDDDG